MLPEINIVALTGNVLLVISKEEGTIGNLLLKAVTHDELAFETGGAAAVVLGGGVSAIDCTEATEDIAIDITRRNLNIFGTNKFEIGSYTGF